jgi:hypothetical protein
LAALSLVCCAALLLALARRFSPAGFSLLVFGVAWSPDDFFF